MHLSRKLLLILCSLYTNSKINSASVTSDISVVGSCLASEYRCNGGQCISGSNKCDGYRQCGESIDECEVTRTLSWIAGVVVGVIFILVFIGLGVFCLRRFLRRRNNSGGVVKVCYKF